jgi:CrcB protein
MAVALAGGVGAVARHMLDSAVSARTAGVFPWGTLLVNISGSLALGLLAGAATAHALPVSWGLVVGTGFLGGYTTFSTFVYETFRLLEEGSRLEGALNTLGTVAAGTVAAGLGLWLGGLG